MDPSVERRAVVVGIDAYATKPLRNAVRDAKAVSGLLVRDYGFRLFPNDDKPLLNHDADLRNMEDAIVKSLHQSDAATRWLFYFAGHGEPGYLVPAGASDGNGLGLEWLVDQGLGSPCGEILIILDTCYAGQILMRSDPPREEKGSGSDHGTLQILAAGGPHQSVRDDGGKRHSVFTQYLVDALDGWAGIHEDGSVPFTELREYMDQHAAEQLKPDEQQLLGRTIRKGSGGDFRFEPLWPRIPAKIVQGARNTDPETRRASLAQLAAACRRDERSHGPDLHETVRHKLPLALRLALHTLPGGSARKALASDRNLMAEMEPRLRRQTAQSLGELGQLRLLLPRERLVPRDAFRIGTGLLLLAVCDGDARVRRTACRNLGGAVEEACQVRLGERLDRLRSSAAPPFPGRLWPALAALPGWRRTRNPLGQTLAWLTLGPLAAVDGWHWLTETRLRRSLLRLAGAGLALFCVALGTSYSTSVGRRSEVVLRRGFSGFEILPGVGSPIAVTDYLVEDLKDPAIATEERVIGSWFLRRDGAFDWGHRLAAQLGPGEASLALWRLGARERALERLAEELAAEQAASFRTAVYLALHDEALAETAFDGLTRSLASDDAAVRDEARRGLEALRLIRPAMAGPAPEQRPAKLANREPPAVLSATDTASTASADPAPVASPTLLAAAGAADDEVRAKAVRSLVELALDGRMDARDLAPVLTTALKDRRTWVRQEAAYGVVLLAERSGPLHDAACAEIFEGERSSRAHSFPAAGSSRRFQRSSTPAVVLFGRCLLRTASRQEGVPDHRFFQELQGLVAARPEILPELVPALNELLSQPQEKQLTWETAQRLRDLRKVGVDLTPLSERFLDQLSSAATTERRAAAFVLGSLVTSSPELVARTLRELENAMSDPDPGVVARVSESLFWIGLDGKEPARVLRLVLRGFQDPRAPVRSSFARSLDALTREGVRFPEPLPAIVIETLADPRADVRTSAARIVGRWASRRPGERDAASALLAERLQREEELAVRLALAAGLLPLAGDDSVAAGQVFDVASEGLGSAEENSQSTRLLVALARRDPGQAPRVVRALLERGVREDSSNRVQVLYALRDVGKIDRGSGELAFRALGDILRDKDWEPLSWYTLRSLETIAQAHPSLVPRVLELLEEALDIPSRHVDFRRQGAGQGGALGGGSLAALGEARAGARGPRPRAPAEQARLHQPHSPPRGLEGPREPPYRTTRVDPADRGGSQARS